MLNRRQFVTAVAACATTFVRAPGAFAAAAAKYDLIIRGGRVIDPSVRLDAIRDVAISEGRIAAVQSNIAGDAGDGGNGGAGGAGGLGTVIGGGGAGGNAGLGGLLIGSNGTSGLPG